MSNNNMLSPISVQLPDQGWILVEEGLRVKDFSLILPYRLIERDEAYGSSVLQVHIAESDASKCNLSIGSWLVDAEIHLVLLGTQFGAEAFARAHFGKTMEELRGPKEPEWADISICFTNDDIKNRSIYMEQRRELWLRENG
ncbi:MAG: hypothetical protein JST40_05810 [Armatimonadetes bacterium]|nr:hypothetical protein [Armatimonadota bacterium]